MWWWQCLFDYLNQAKHLSDLDPTEDIDIIMEASTATAMPSSMEDFETDPRIHFNTVSGKWEIEDDDGNEMQWDPLKGAWAPIVSMMKYLYSNTQITGRLCRLTRS